MSLTKEEFDKEMQVLDDEETLAMVDVNAIRKKKSILIRQFRGVKNTTIKSSAAKKIKEIRKAMKGHI